MRIGVIFAMDEELNELLKLIILEKKTKIFDITFYEGKMHNKDIVLVKSGIGKVNSGRVTQLLIDKMNVDYIFNIGVAGSIDKSINIGDIVVSEKLVQYDFDISAFGHEIGYITNIGTYINSDKELLNKSKGIKGFKTHYGVIATGDKFITDDNISKKINSDFNALCVEMEGASIAQVCYLCNKPFLVIRCISDSIYESDNKVKYEEFLLTSSKMVAEYLNELMEVL